jgi:hypothetical protein
MRPLHNYIFSSVLLTCAFPPLPSGIAKKANTDFVVAHPHLLLTTKDDFRELAFPIVNLNIVYVISPA